MKAPKGSAEWRERVAKGTRAGLDSRRRKRELEQERLRVRPRDLALWEESGQVSESARPALEIAADEAAALTRGLGGQEEVSEQVALLVADYARLGAHLALLNAMIFREPASASDLISKASTVIGQRRQILALLGLARFERSIDPTRPLTVEFSNDDDDSTAGASFSPAASGDGSPSVAGAGAAASACDGAEVAPRAKPIDLEDAL